MQYLYSDIRTQNEGTIIEITVKFDQNVMLMNYDNFYRYQSGGQFSYYGGFHTPSTFKMTIPFSSDWVVVANKGGYPGYISLDLKIVENNVEKNLLSEIKNIPAEKPSSSTIFISHATEDKKSFARPLVDLLVSKGANIWYDELNIKPGEELLSAIGNGLNSCSMGVVIISKEYIKKSWTVSELNAMIDLKNSKKMNLFFIWHDIDKSEVQSFNSIISGMTALETNKQSLEDIATSIYKSYLAEINIAQNEQGSCDVS